MGVEGLGSETGGPTGRAEWQVSSVIHLFIISLLATTSHLNNITLLKQIKTKDNLNKCSTQLAMMPI